MRAGDAEPERTDVPDADAPAAARQPDAGAGPDAPGDGRSAGVRGATAASATLTPGGARLRQPPQAEAMGSAGLDAGSGPRPTLPWIPLRRYYLGVILLLVGVGTALYASVDIYQGREGEAGGFTLVALARLGLGIALGLAGQRVLGSATHDPRARR